MAREFLRILCALALALAIEQLCASVLPHLPGAGATTVFAQGTAVPPPSDPRGASGYGGYANPTGATQGYGPNPFGGNSYGPNSPTPPVDAARPASWPGGPGSQTAPPPTEPPQPQAPLPKKDPLEPPIEPAMILAHVGSEVVQAAEILPSVHQTIDAYIEKNLAEKFYQAPESVQREMRTKWEREVLEKTLKDAVDVKLLLNDLKGVAPEEGIKKNRDRFRELFNDQEIKRLLNEYKAASTTDLENKLLAEGGSLESQRTAFIDRYMAVGWVQQKISDQKEPSHEELVAYYRQNITEWERPARARWEQLTVKFSEFPTKAAAWKTIAQWGKDVQRGVPFAQVAKAHSHSVSAEEGGLNDWTTQGSLRSEVLDWALFTLPVGALSQILTDDDGFHIVRVVEREERHTIPFSDVQAEIKEKLKSGDKQALIQEYIAKLRDRVPVHTVFDDQSSSLANRPGQTPR